VRLTGIAVAFRVVAALDASTRLSGIIGRPVSHSLSPAMHNAAFAACGLNWAYLAFDVEDARVAEAMTGLAAAGCAGLNVTIPHKQTVMAHCSSVSEAATAIGAVNTLIPDGSGGWHGDNTDAAGFARAVDDAVPEDVLAGVVLLVGAGGAARAVAHAVATRGGRLLVSNRSPEKAAELGWVVPFDPISLNAAAAQAALVVNATSLGMGSDDVPSELPLVGIGPEQVVNDLVYRPGGTPWSAAAAARGARTVDGLGMLLHQGAAAFEQWTGTPAPVDVMRAALQAARSAPKNVDSTHVSADTD
jgi:shikimate dehydrogenase